MRVKQNGNRYFIASNSVPASPSFLSPAAQLHSLPSCPASLTVLSFLPLQELPNLQQPLAPSQLSFSLESAALLARRAKYLCLHSHLTAPRLPSHTWSCSSFIPLFLVVCPTRPSQDGRGSYGTMCSGPVQDWGHQVWLFHSQEWHAVSNLLWPANRCLSSQDNGNVTEPLTLQF